MAKKKVQNKTKKNKKTNVTTTVQERWITIKQFSRETKPKHFIMNPCDILYGKPAYFNYLMDKNITKIQNGTPYINTTAYNRYIGK